MFSLICFILSRAETCIFAVRFLLYAFHCQPVWKPRVPPGTFQPKLMQTLSSQVPHDHLSSNASQEATAPADTEAWLGSSPLYLLLKILLLPFLSCRIEVPRESVGTAESRGRADQVGATAALPAPLEASPLCLRRDGAGPEHAEVWFATGRSFPSPGVRREGGTAGRRGRESAGTWRALGTRHSVRHGRSSELLNPSTRLDFTEWLCLLSFGLATHQGP